MRFYQSVIPIGTIRTILKIAPNTFRGFLRYIFPLALLGFVTGILEAVGINALVPLFSFFDTEGRQPVDFVSRNIERFFGFFGLPLAFPSVLAFIVILFVSKFAVSMFYSYVSSRIETSYENRTMSRMLEKTLKADWPFLLKQVLGRLETLMKVDTRRSGEMLSATADLLRFCMSMVAYFLVAVNISKTVTVVSVVFGGLLFIFYKPLFSYGRALSTRISEINVVIAHHINQSLLGIKSIKALGAEKQVLDSGKTLFERLRKLQLKSLVLTRITVDSIQPLGIIFIALIVAFAFYRTSYNLGALAALIYLINRIFNYTQNIQSVAHAMISALPYAENISNYMSETEQTAEDRHGQRSKKFHFENNLVFDSVSFTYAGMAHREALHSISFEVKRGELVGLIGPSGAGKSTIFDLLLQLLRPTSGKILIDGVDIYAIDMSDWRQNISYVPQDTFVLNDTIYNNITFYNPLIRKEDVLAAAQAAQLDDLLGTLPQGFDTVVGERGVMMSGGQRQRIALARAMARKPKVILLDEATSALDNESERRIHGVIEKMKGGVTVFVIAHRLSTVMGVDQLIVLGDGRVVERGKPQQLLQNRETYFHRVYNLRQ